MKKKLKDKKITIYKTIQSNDGYQTEQYKPIHPGTLWAYFRHLSGREYHETQMSGLLEENVVFVVNWRPDYTVLSARTLLIRFRDVWYDVQRVDAFEGYKSDVQLFCKFLDKAPKDSEILPYA